jgi:tetratricopeptide (TPR) repeat protein/tRNA A-37 threonylcarbamoyl transferase component Bud32
MSLRDELQQTLGGAYILERELGGGGMSRVFVAEELALGRKVVVKVLPPEIAAGVNVDRFKREIQMAARLQHPHIVPVLTAGQMGDTPYYTMPFVEGESVRARLQRSGALSLTEAIGILRDVAKALSYAHERGIVHRDIKPDNVLLSGGSATVADFGIAKAIAAARSDTDTGRAATLTQLGSSLGTPAYMAPEQAAADPATNHRADIYAFGCMAYELLTGAPPFNAKTPQKLLAAQMGETPVPIKSLRLDVPDALAELVMRCLEKDADHRPQQASQLVEVLETVTSGGGHAAMPAILLGGTHMIRKALLIYAAAFAAVAILAKAAIVGIGLPDWVFPGALVVMALGLPVILFTAYVHHTTRKVVTRTPTYTPGGTPSAVQGTLATLAIKASPHVSWRRTWMGGVAAAGIFVLLVASYMTLRAFGIGRFGSLLAAGTLQHDERLLVTDFSPPAHDTTLGPVITDAFRTALGQSRSITVMQPQQVADVLRLMQRSPRTPVDFTVGREIATREGIRGVVVGDIISLGGNYAISVRLVSPQSGDELASFRETAESDKELLRAIDKLAKELRSKIGESLKSVQSTRAFEQVTTPSLDALKKYVQGSLALSLDGDFAKGRPLLEQAIALDTGFAMAYRKLAVEYANRAQPDKAMEYIQKAYDHRARLTDVERYYMLGGYYDYGPQQDPSKAAEAYESAIELQPNLVGAINNVANDYRRQRNFPKAEEMYLRAIRSGNPPAVSFSNLIGTEIILGKPVEAWKTLAAFDSAYPANNNRRNTRVGLLINEGKYDSADVMAKAVIRDRPNDLPIRAGATNALATIARTRGQLRESARRRTELAAADLQRGVTQANLNRDIAGAVDRVWFLGDAAGASAMIDKAVAETPLEKLPTTVRPYDALATAYALAGQLDKARRIAAAFEKSRQNTRLAGDTVARHSIQGAIAMAEKRYDDAAREYRASDAGTCTMCALPQLANAYDQAGKSDSAIAIYRRYFKTPDVGHAGIDAQYAAATHKRLGELYEAKNDRTNALDHYDKFVELWKNSDPELQPQVAEVRKRIARLRTTKG